MPRVLEVWNVTSPEPNVSVARLVQSAERKALNLVVVGSSPTVGEFHGAQLLSVMTRNEGTSQMSARREIPRSGDRGANAEFQYRCAMPSRNCLALV